MPPIVFVNGYQNRGGCATFSHKLRALNQALDILEHGEPVGFENGILDDNALHRLSDEEVVSEGDAMASVTSLISCSQSL